jgi:hypothetical protein
MRRFDGEEPNRLAGFPIARVRRYGEEPQHAMGVPLAWQEPVGGLVVVVRAVLHPLCALRGLRHRRAIASLLD